MCSQWWWHSRTGWKIVINKKRVRGKTIHFKICPSQYGDIWGRAALKTGANPWRTLIMKPGVTNQSFGSASVRPSFAGQSRIRVRVMQNSVGNNDVSSFTRSRQWCGSDYSGNGWSLARPFDIIVWKRCHGRVVTLLIPVFLKNPADKLLGGAAWATLWFCKPLNLQALLSLKVERNNLLIYVDGFIVTRGNMHIGGQPIDELLRVQPIATLEGTSVLDNPFRAS